MTNETIAIDELPAVTASEFHTHPRRFLTKSLVYRGIFFFFLAAGVVASFIFWEELYSWLLLGLWLILLAFVLITAVKGYYVRGYLIRELDVTYKKGWVFHSQTTVPFNRIQHVEVNHGPLDRLFTLRHLKIYTAGGSSSDLRISGLEPEKAEKIKTHIMHKVDADA